MRNKDNIEELLSYLQEKSDQELLFERENVFKAYQNKEDHQSLAIKILSVFGGLMSGLAFVGFLFLTGLFESNQGLVIFGGLCIAGSILLNKAVHKIIIDTMSVTFYLIGFVLLGIGLSDSIHNESIICFIFMLIALCSLLVVQNYIISFVSILMINGCTVALLTFNELTSMIYIYIALIAVLITFLFLNEAKILALKNIVSKLCEPLRSALVFTFLGTFIFVNYEKSSSFSYAYFITSSVVIILSILYVVYHLFKILNIKTTQHKTITLIATAVLLAPTANSPAISGAILIILVSFMVNYKTGFGLGIIAFVYFISMFYYNLQFTLLTKSIILFSSGILFLTLYFFTRKKLISHEKI
ncbi:DUF4401 domain-containing protein [Chryseobacterium sp. PBS4-4]|uniref:DUF4401 domain-containing protein n=1 Tax=Chryseobacterium edaphi TaxID=2976532 RepID=A0ABT2W710_9FLAO|nr:DUF4401 domain-containing protein [Chryseobacterium edaphi]MCU7617992.1 DUF4401 domain-containing protein [Chryseobacterium edaphi]